MQLVTKVSKIECFIAPYLPGSVPSQFSGERFPMLSKERWFLRLMGYDTFKELNKKSKRR